MPQGGAGANVNNKVTYLHVMGGLLLTNNSSFRKVLQY